MDSLLDAQKEIYSLLQKEEATFLEIRQSNEPLFHRWQKFIGMILPIQLQAIEKFGWEKTQEGLSRFNEEFMEKAATDRTLRKLNEDKWRFLFEKAFGLKECKSITLEQARNLITEIEAAMIHEDFLQKIDQTVHGQSTVEKRQALLTILIPLHMSIMEKHGFPGEEGYIQAQRALMDYYYDPLIAEKANNAQKVIFKRAKLIG